jgi:hypothetical protein
MSERLFNFDLVRFCALPLVRRVYQALVVGLAMFLLTLVILHDPFRGYLSEVDLSGPATEGVDLDEAATWLRRADSKVAAIGIPAGEISPKNQLRVTYVSLHPATAIARLNELAERWLYQYLPEKLQSYRRTALSDLRNAVAAARAREDAAREQLESLRQEQMAQVLNAADERLIAQAANKPAGGVVNLPPPAIREDQAKAREKLESLRLELSRLLAHSTHEHPQVIAIEAQISALEARLGDKPPSNAPGSSDGPELVPTPSRHSAQAKPREARPVSHWVSMPLSSASGGGTANLNAQINSALDAVSRASRDRQLAEHRLSDRMQELASQSSAAQWSAGRAVVITRLGGTPRSSVLALGALLAAVTSALTFRAAHCSVALERIETTSQLTTALKLPLIGAISMNGNRTATWRLITPTRVKAVVYASEAIVAVAVVACLVAIAAEPSLARQVLADPFGALSEVMGRFL